MIRHLVFFIHNEDSIEETYLDKWEIHFGSTVGTFVEHQHLFHIIHGIGREHNFIDNNSPQSSQDGFRMT